LSVGGRGFAATARIEGAADLIATGQLRETVYEVYRPMPATKPAKNGAAPRTTRQIGRYIVADPQVCHGKLTFRGTRIFVSDVLEQVERGMPWDTIVEEWYGKVPQEAIAEAVRLARESLLEHAAEYAVPGVRRRAG
jgi:uncharacterized protein (DUF433 family)